MAIEAVQPSITIFKPKPIPRTHFSPFQPDPKDVLLPGSSDDDSDGTRAVKRQRREDACQYYLRLGEPKYIATAQLKGPFAPEHVVRQRRRPRERKTRVSSEVLLGRELGGRMNGLTTTTTAAAKILAPSTPSPWRPLSKDTATRETRERMRESSPLVLPHIEPPVSSPTPPESPVPKARKRRIVKGRAPAQKRRDARYTPLQESCEAVESGKSGNSRRERGQSEAVADVESAADSEAVASCSRQAKSQPRPVMKERLQHIPQGQAVGSPFEFVRTRRRRRLAEKLGLVEKLDAGVAADVEIAIDPLENIVEKRNLEKQSSTGPCPAPQQSHCDQSEQTGSPLADQATELSIPGPLRPSTDEDIEDSAAEVPANNPAEVPASEVLPDAQQDYLSPYVSATTMEQLATEQLYQGSRRSINAMSTQAAFHDALAGMHTPMETTILLEEQALAENSEIDEPGPKLADRETQDAEIGTQDLFAKAPRFSIGSILRPTRAFKSVWEHTQSSPIAEVSNYQVSPFTPGPAAMRQAADDDSLSEEGTSSMIDIMQALPSSGKNTALDTTPAQTPTLNRSFDGANRMVSVRHMLKSSRISTSKKRKPLTTRKSASQPTGSLSQGLLTGKLTKSNKNTPARSAFTSMKASSEWQDAQKRSLDVELFARNGAAAGSGMMDDEKLNETIHDIQGFLDG